MIQGDEQDNYINVNLKSGNTYEVSNYSGTAGDTGTINGRKETLTFSNVKAIDIVAKGGNDRVGIGVGGDHYKTANLNSVSVNMGRSNVRGEGREQVYVGSLKIANNFSVVKDQNDPNPNSSLLYSHLKNSIEVGGQIKIVGGRGQDHIEIDYGSFGSIDVQTGIGNDFVKVGTLEGLGSYSARRTIVAKKVTISTGAGQDTAAIYGAAVDHFMAKLGDDKDTFFFGNNTFRGFAEVDGGLGDDEFIANAPYALGSKLLKLRSGRLR